MTIMQFQKDDIEPISELNEYSMFYLSIEEKLLRNEFKNNIREQKLKRLMKR